MKSYAGIIIAFLIGVFAVSAGWGGAIYAVLLLIGLLTIVVLGALALTCLDKRKAEGNEQSKAVSEEPGRIEDGTWTLNIPQGRHRDSVWIAWLDRESISHPRFQRARFVLAEGPAVLISAADLRRALADWLADPKDANIRPFKIDFEHNTVNGVPVEMSSGT